MCDSSRVNMVRALLRPYEYRAWAQSNWVLVRIWQGCGFAFRYHKSPHLLRKLGPKLLQEHFSLINQSLSMCFILVVTCYERLKANSHIASVPMPSHWGFRMCLSHLMYTVRPCLIHTCYAMPVPCSDYAVLLKATAQHVRREMASGLPARVRLLPATTRSSTKIFIGSIPVLLTTIHTYDCKSGSNALR